MKKLFLFVLIVLGNVSCKKSEVEPDDENELITTVKLNFTAGGTTQSFIFQDADGDGGKAPTRFDEVTLKPNTTYALTVQFLDESKTPIGDITEEVLKEADEHLVVYTPAPAALLTYTYSDKDKNNLPLGLAGSAKTNAAGTGTLKVQLRHQPGAKNGTVTPGSDDVNLDFKLNIR